MGVVDTGNLRHIAVNADGRLLLCNEDRAQLNRIERGIKWLVFEAVQRGSDGSAADVIDGRMRAIFGVPE